MNKGREIKQILLGRFIQDGNGKTVALPKGPGINLCGLPDGWGSVMIFGIAKSCRRYRTDMKKNKAMDIANESLTHVGRCIELQETPGIMSSYCRSVTGATVLITAEWEDDCVCITAFSGRSPLAVFSRMKALRHYEKKLPDDFERIKKEKRVNKA